VRLMISPNVAPTVPVPPTSGPRTTEITLRDHFAGQALQGLIASGDPDSGIRSQDPNLNGHVNLARTCYRLADAMLAARKAAL
jgi:hypothetical protein